MGPVDPVTPFEQQQMVLFAKYPEYDDDDDAILVNYVRGIIMLL
jgi:hypothetical protein